MNISLGKSIDSAPFILELAELSVLFGEIFNCRWLHITARNESYLRTIFNVVTKYSLLSTLFEMQFVNIAQQWQW